MQKISCVCLALFMLFAVTPAYAAQHTTDADDPPAVSGEASTPQPSSGTSTNEYVNYNSDGTERSDLQKEDAARRVMNGEGSSGPTGQEDMFPHNGKLH